MDMESIRKFHIPDDVFERLGGKPDAESAVWSCAVCGTISPKQYTNGYLPGTCACQRKEKERKEEEKLQQQLREARLAEKRAQAAKCYTWLGEHLNALKLKSFENYDQQRFPEVYAELFKMTHQYDESGKFVMPCKNMLIFGSYGTGKTHLMAALCNTLTERLIRCRFMTGQGIFDAISAAISNKQDYQHYIDEASSVPLLAIDDVDKVHIPRHADSEDNFQVKTFFNIINKRNVQGLPTFITTNALDVTTYIGGAAFSRLKENGMFIEMTGNDYRDTMIRF